jgi:tripartite-type tricarboxylate transporter receptor subunit TctC
LHEWLPALAALVGAKPPLRVPKWLARLIAVAASSAASAQAARYQYPNQAVRIVMPVSPGSIADGFARMIAEKLGEFWKQPVVVENRSGSSGVAGRIYVISGGPTPGASASAANEIFVP